MRRRRRRRRQPWEPWRRARADRGSCEASGEPQRARGEGIAEWPGSRPRDDSGHRSESDGSESDGSESDCPADGGGRSRPSLAGSTRVAPGRAGSPGPCFTQADGPAGSGTDSESKAAGAPSSQVTVTVTVAAAAAAAVIAGPRNCGPGDSEPRSRAPMPAWSDRVSHGDETVTLDGHTAACSGCRAGPR